MDEEYHRLIQEAHNNTDELNDFKFGPSAWDVINDSIVIIFTILGLLADVIMIYLVARNKRMRSKTNLLLMNFAINDACFLACNIHFLVSTLQIFGAREHYPVYTNCVFRFADEVFQINQLIFLLILISNTLMKSKRVQIKWLLITSYTCITVNFLLNLIVCHYNIWHAYIYSAGFFVFMLNFGTVLFKEINGCYKNVYKEDPLSQRTRFRLTIGRIYVGSWFIPIIVGMFMNFDDFLPIFMIVHQSYMSSLFVLIYIVYADKNFKICLLNLLRCKGAGNYDVDATITYGEDYSEDNPTDNHINININNTT